MFARSFYLQFSIGAVLGSLIACSPTKFSQTQNANTLCGTSTTASCVSQNGSVSITDSYTIGSGKVDVLFVNDNSASMSRVQVQLASRFAGFIQSLDARGIDYRIAIVTTDLGSVSQNGLVTFGNGQKFITKADANRISLFNNAIIRNETLNCENLITTMFNTYGVSFQSNSYYASQYPLNCPSSDTRGIHTAHVVVANNVSSFLRDDANLNVILISNDDARQGAALENLDRGTTFTSMLEQTHPGKYWDFSSIIVKDNTCKQSQTLRNSANQVVMNQYGPAISGGIGVEYANLSNSAARDIDGNPRPRGKVLDICQTDYAQHFSTMSTQIAEDGRMLTMKCTPISAPTVLHSGVVNPSIEYTWNGDKIVFKRGNETKTVTVSYTCYTGPT